MIIHVINQLPTSFRRVVIVMSLLLAAVNVAWGQAVSVGSFTFGYAKGTDASVSANFESFIKDKLGIVSDPDDLSKCFARWDLKKKGVSNYVSLDQWNTSAGKVKIDHADQYKYGVNDNYYQYCYNNPLSQILNATLKINSGDDYSGYELECFFY